MAALAAASAAVQVWRRRESPQACWLATVLFGAAWWAGIAVLEYATTALWGKIFFSQLTYLGIELAPLAVWRFAHAYTHDGAAPSRGWRWLANGWVGAVLVATFTNGWHHWLWPEVRLIDADGFVQAWYGRGWLFWANVVYCYGAMAVAVLIFLRHALASQGVLRRQGWVLLIATLTPWVTSGLYLLRLGPWGRVDHTPVGFVAMGLILLWGLRRFQLLDLRPVASRTLFDSMGDPVLVVDARGRLVLANPAAQVQLGLASESVGRDVAEVLTARPALIAALGRRVPEETVADGPTWWHLRATPLDTQGMRLFVLRDVSEQKRAELALGEALRRADASAQEAHAANAAKSIFLAQVSHELRTPLHAILGYAQLLGADATLPAGARERLHIVGSSGRHLLRLINEVLDLAKIEAGKLEVKAAPFDLPALLTAVAAAHEPRAVAKGLAFRRSDPAGLPVCAVADAAKLRQVLENLLGNAIKFTGRGEVRLLALPVAAGRVRFEVSDTGPGIAPADLARIFQPFTQLAAAGPAAPEGGTGLGLAIAQRLVALLGGRLEVASLVGQGSRFWFDLPLVEVAGPAAPAAPRRIVGYEGPRRRILAVDDVAANRRLFVDLLAPLGFELAEAGSAAETLARLETFRPDLVLLDLRLPDRDGFALARQLRADPRLEGVKLLAASASVFNQDPAGALAAGCDGFIAKPFLHEEFLARVGELLGLTWRTVDEAAPVAAEPLDPQLLEPLRAAAEAGDVVAMREALHRLRERHPGAAALAPLEQAIAAFDTAGVVRLARQSPPPSPGPIRP